MSSGNNYFVHTLLHAHNWQHRPQFDHVCDWWRDGAEVFVRWSAWAELARRRLSSGF